jgi:hypothetical protein
LAETPRARYPEAWIGRWVNISGVGTAAQGKLLDVNGHGITFEAPQTQHPVFVPWHKIDRITQLQSSEDR